MGLRSTARGERAGKKLRACTLKDCIIVYSYVHRPSQEPILSRLPGNEFLLSKEALSIFIGLNSKPTRQYALNFTEQPICIDLVSPYAIALTARCVDTAAAAVIYFTSFSAEKIWRAIERGIATQPSATARRSISTHWLLVLAF